MIPEPPPPVPSRVSPPVRPQRRRVAVLCALLVGAAAGAPLQAQAQDERESLESLRQTTLALIEALVQGGVLGRAKADALIADARQHVAAASAPAASAPKAEPAPPPVVRVPYVPQVVRDQIRDEVREEVVARARLERWGVPNATAEWTDRIAIEGDLRVRSQNDRPNGTNPSPADFLAGSTSGVTRAADFAAGTSAGLPTGSTQDDINRMRLRARLAFNVKVADTVTAGLRLATGSASDRVSTNQTLGQDFNRYTFLLDRAFVKIDPTPWLSASAGRIANPWFSTDLVWSENLNFEGVAATASWPALPTSQFLPFATVGYFPVRQSSAARRGRNIFGAQVGMQWEFSELTRLKFGLAQYTFQGFEGHVDADYSAVSGAGNSYGQYEYEAGLRQRGNTLFLTNSPYEFSDTGGPGVTAASTRWGLASRFKPIALTAAAEFSHFAPVVIGITGEVVRNSAFNRIEIEQRTGVALYDSRVFGVQIRGTLGAAQVRNRGDWQLSLGVRWLGSDAVPDAFVDSDLGGGGTNLRGVMIGFNYGIARDAQFGARYLSAQTISSPTVQHWLNDRYSLDTLQVDLNVRF